ncbi:MULTISPECIES: type I methionyl aminopeptidase [Sporomusa]|jgi:methionyl aminopeptidase|uniref:Methionine aminopeptidase n=2 Tax=Sporomusa TaxID=2375 RepID=A0ABM9W7L4_9FIRM|nr:MULTISPECIES: type I methionyl aminopeptidase [Sporomusa]MCM0761540.1 type I methionyl aminopeptidase [Sporomusa sphaeroides DSM 2875]OLS56954.1 methionine aminopeptidase 1 [Sporomusa sphaeroides DSM 2875]CVK21138.1 Methionine aminopeptidase 1 [Sporomusa sphaeroides DSM 2875]SCM81764.1 Methionine aminopeptidase [uncultured Sporomusa sp.]HML32053.1 type I methionyl aminopeptidase [Sporomusa sphaeroides]
MIILKSQRELNYLRDAGRIVAETLAEIKKAAQPDVTTLELDRIAEQYIKSKGATPAFKGYHGFPGNICASINDEVVHGIPGLKRLKTGDNVSIDIGAFINGYCGDAAITVAIGEVDAEVEKLIEVTEQSLYKGIEQAIAGNRLGDISHSIQAYAEGHGYGVVRDFVGHGIGRNMHEDPQVPNYGLPGRGPRLKAGMTLAIEPMINAGTHEVKTLSDNWTVVTADGKRSAHFEHTIAITADGPEILTKL